MWGFLARYQLANIWSTFFKMTESFLWQLLNVRVNISLCSSWFAAPAFFFGGTVKVDRLFVVCEEDVS